MDKNNVLKYLTDVIAVYSLFTKVFDVKNRKRPQSISSSTLWQLRQSWGIGSWQPRASERERGVLECHFRHEKAPCKPCDFAHGRIAKQIYAKKKHSYVSNCTTLVVPSFLQDRSNNCAQDFVVLWTHDHN